MDSLQDINLNHLYTLPNGAIVVIFEVPALMDPDTECEEYLLCPETVDRLSQLIDQVAARNPAPKEVVCLKYTDSELAYLP